MEWNGVKFYFVYMERARPGVYKSIRERDVVGIFIVTLLGVMRMDG
jgi:hypothetical protein